MGERKLILALLVKNENGVLTRISGLFARRGFNIDNLSVGVTQDPKFSRMTIQARGDDYVRMQLVEQLRKLHDVKVIECMDLDRTVCRELLLVKAVITPETRGQVLDAVNVFRANVYDLSQHNVTMGLTGDSSKLDAFIAYLKQTGIIEVCRTGLTAIGRGDYILKDEETVNYG